MMSLHDSLNSLLSKGELKVKFKNVVVKLKTVKRTRSLKIPYY